MGAFCLLLRQIQVSVYLSLTTKMASYFESGFIHFLGLSNVSYPHSQLVMNALLAVLQSVTQYVTQKLKNRRSSDNDSSCLYVAIFELIDHI